MLFSVQVVICDWKLVFKPFVGWMGIMGTADSAKVTRATLLRALDDGNAPRRMYARNLSAQRPRNWLMAQVM